MMSLSKAAPNWFAMVTGEDLEKLHREILAEASRALQQTRLPKLYPTSKWEIDIQNGIIQARVKQRDWVLPSAS